MDETELRPAYASALASFIDSGSDSDLARAQELGYEALEGGLDSAAVVLIHFDSLSPIESKDEPLDESIERSRRFLLEAIHPFAVTRHRYREMVEELALLNDNLIARGKELEIANDELEAFSFSMSHDLRTSLQAVIGFAQTLASRHWDELTPEARRYLDLILKSANGMNELISDLLELARASRLPITYGTVDLGDVAREAISELKPQIEAADAELVVGRLPVVDGDRVLLKRVLVNLVSNAVKFSRSGESRARVEIESFKQNGDDVVLVRDNGVGFDMKNSARLFRAFERLHRRDEYEGTGIGLALVARIIDRHGGRVWAESEPGKGATFYFALTRSGSSQELDRAGTSSAREHP
jgi:light-regulated signal transduction histidine kinase (bacteriophytochrome)